MRRMQLLVSQSAFLTTVNFGVAGSATVGSESQVIGLDSCSAVTRHAKVSQYGCFAATVATVKPYLTWLTSG